MGPTPDAYLSLSKRLRVNIRIFVSRKEKRKEKKKKKKRANNHHLNYGQIYIFRVLQVFSLGLRLSRNITSSFKFND